MKGACESFASLRAISVFPTPVGPIMMMFFGATSSRSSAGRLWRRQRLRSAMATAFLAASWPTMYRSSSVTISVGVSGVASVTSSSPRRPRSAVRMSAKGAKEPYRSAKSSTLPLGKRSFERLDRYVIVRIDADARGDPERLLGDLLGREAGVGAQRPRRRQRVRPARADADQPVVGLDHVARAGHDEGDVGIRDRQERLKAAQHAVHPPVLCQLDGGAGEVAAVLLELRLELDRKSTRLNSSH